MRSEHEDAHRGVTVAQLVDEGDSRTARERKIGDHELRLQDAHGRQRRFDIARIAHDLEIGLELEQRAQPLAQDHVILDQQDANLCSRDGVHRRCDVLGERISRALLCGRYLHEHFRIQFMFFCARRLVFSRDARDPCAASYVAPAELPSRLDI